MDTLAWGENGGGQLGLGDTTERHSPVPITVDSNNQPFNNIFSISTGSCHTAAIKSDGTLWTWGCNPSGQLGLGDTDLRLAPTKVGNNNDWVAVDAGCGFNTVALKSDGTLWVWGLNDYGQLGLGDYDERHSPVKLGNDTNWVAIALGCVHTLALKSDGSLWAWGRNDSGQLGDGTTINRFLPVSITVPPSPLTLSSPSDGTTDVPTSTTLTWNASYTASSYRLQISTSQNFYSYSIIFDQSSIGGTSQTVYGLPSLTTLYWRVNASNAGGKCLVTRVELHNSRRT